jgi:glutaredoxin
MRAAGGLLSNRWFRLKTTKETPMKTATFYHAGCPVCVSAEAQFIAAIDANSYNIEVVHLGDSPDRLDHAEGAGVKSVPALVLDGQPFHINFGANLADLR